MGEQGQGSDQTEAHEHVERMVDGTSRLEQAAKVWPVGLIGVLLLVSAWWDGAFDLRYWAPLTILALAVLVAQMATGGLSIPRRDPVAVATVAIWCLPDTCC